MNFKAFFFTSLFILSTITGSQALAGNELSVVTSIRPLQLIANEIMEGSGQAQVLIGDNQSPHHFQLKPSQLRMVSASDLLIWISNHFESAMGTLGQNLRQESTGIQLIKVIPAENLIGDHGDIDGHIWLDPKNVILIGQLIANQLAALDPEREVLYQNNLAGLTTRVSNWAQATRIKLEQLQPRYISEHQFLAYFERSFDLPTAASLRSAHDHGGSVRRLSSLHSILDASPVSCLLVSSLPVSRQVSQFSEEHGLKVKVISTLNEGNTYNTIVDLLDAIATTLEECR
jgi:zinc transport system substrate-binding protein